MQRQIAHPYPAAHRVADKRRVAHARLFDHISEIVGKSIEIVTAGWLVRKAEHASVLHEDSEAGLGKLRSLMVPDIGIQRPGVGHHDGAAGAPGILDEKLGAVPGLDLDGTPLAESKTRQGGGGRRGGKGAKGSMEGGNTGGPGQASVV